MAKSFGELQEERVRRLTAKFAHTHVAEPKVNPLQYSTRRSSYPSDPNHVDWRDPAHAYWTRLHFAVQAGDLKAVQDLIAVRGANPWVRNVCRQRPLDMALDWGQWEIARYVAREMDRINQECAEYIRRTGRKLGLRSQRQKYRRQPSKSEIQPERALATVFTWCAEYVEREYEDKKDWLSTVSHERRRSPHHW